MSPASDEKWRPFNSFFSVQGTDNIPTGPDPENRVSDQDIGRTGRPVSSGFQVPGEPGHCRARTRPPWWISRGILPSNCPSVRSAEVSNTRRWYFGLLEGNQCGGCRLDPKIKSRRELFQRSFALGIFWGGVSHYAATPLIATFSPVYSDITRFRPWSSITTGNNLDSAKQIPKLLRQVAPLTFLIHVQAFRDPLRGELPHVQNFMNDGHNPLTWDAQLLIYLFSWNLAVFQDKLVNLMNNFRGSHCFGSFRTRRITGGKITTFKMATLFLTVAYNGACSLNVFVRMA